MNQQGDGTMNVLVIDIGGTNIKLGITGQEEVRKVPSGPDLTPQRMVEGVQQTIQDWQFDAITVGFPAPVVRGQILLEPVNLAPGWVGFDFAAAFGKPVKVINDAAMQALGSYEGGRMLFMGLGTGLGTALVIDNVVAPLELAHLPYRKKRTYEDYVGERGLQRLGRKKWEQFVEDVVARFKAAFVVDYIVLGGGNSKKLPRLPPHARAGDNRNALLGGFRLWEVNEETQQHRFGNA
jgi:predicted NBD/HSP70 family sugar kinase